jgi:hypothetical protein
MGFGPLKNGKFVSLFVTQRLATIGALDQLLQVNQFVVRHHLEPRCHGRARRALLSGQACCPVFKLR